MKKETKSLAILALYSMCQKRASAVSSLEFDIDYKRSVVARAASAGAKTRATNELAALEKSLVEAKASSAEADAAIEDLRVSE
jgi:hypothetical protein